MNRSNFLKKLGIGLGVAIVAPKVLAGNETLIDKPTIDFDKEKERFVEIKQPLCLYKPLINDEVFYCDELYLVVRILGDEVTLRPFKIGDDIVLQMEDFEYGRVLVLTNIFGSKTIQI